MATDSPPRVRGAPGRQGQSERHRRLTPACAGSTPRSPPRHPSRSTHPRVCGEHSLRCSVMRKPIDSPPRVRGALRNVDRPIAPNRLTPACAGSTRTASSRSRRRSTHPRVCGEHIEQRNAGIIEFDSPPRVRGAPLSGLCCHRCCRLTPACAGSTSTAAPSRASTPTHPRVCGEHPCTHLANVGYADSPPRVRGARSCRVIVRCRCRLTPACAGSTVMVSSVTPANLTHPRVCGEHAARGDSSGGASDSPPRVRGAQEKQHHRRDPRRLTPACAGSTAPDADGLHPHPTHPRVCGEHIITVVSSSIRHDSPPRVRGAHHIGDQNPWKVRLTPACAGSTLRLRVRCSHQATHPRVCGEHGTMVTPSGSTFDSPPRVRGARPAGAVHPLGVRLTPACAGSTPASRSPTWPRPTHPRVCGEHVISSRRSVQSVDSPPRVRGAPGPVDVDASEHRLTPACAGSTHDQFPRVRRALTHPRVCGEHRNGSASYSMCFDSPPRVRGAPKA